VAGIATEHEADEIAARLHAEMPWMGRATEEVWHGPRASARNGDPDARFEPLILAPPRDRQEPLGAPRRASPRRPCHRDRGDGRARHLRARRRAAGLEQGDAGRLVNTVLRERHAGPVVIVDEIGKAAARSARAATTASRSPTRWCSCSSA
jgi:hypothetical protein